ncbi:hypothetical protein FIC_01238 [Flavobacteriaceae bacterium 3519-10]|nr:hypothetical protein FIC_01238 [Flavobacteriaceae bacterium 3519-10]
MSEARQYTSFEDKPSDPRKFENLTQWFGDCKEPNFSGRNSDL